MSPTHAELPEEVETFLVDAEERIEEFQQNQIVHGFVPSDHRLIFRALQFLKQTSTAPGSLFCEWGSGFGVASCLAEMAGFQSTGIEIEESLVLAARQLAKDYQLQVDFLCDSFIPMGCENCLDDSEPSAWLTTQAGCVQEEYGLSPESFDVIFVYPWPGEEESMEQLFEQHASHGALLLTYNGREGLRLKRKVARTKRSSHR